MQHLGPGNFAERLEFYKWLNGSHELYRYILFTDEAQFNFDSVNNTHNSHMWADENHHATVESIFQLRFSVNVWCAVLDDQLIGPFILEGCLKERHTSVFLRRNCPDVWRMCLRFLNKRGRMYFQHDCSSSFFMSS